VASASAASRPGIGAEPFVERLRALRPHRDPSTSATSPAPTGNGGQVLGLPMGQVFGLAKEFVDMAPDEIERLLDSPVYEARVGALSIMDKQARRKRTPEARRAELYQLYRRRMDRIDDWGLVDLGAQFVVGGYLFDKPRDALYELARSANVWERRTAMWSCMYFVRHGQLDDTFAIAEMLVDDPEHLVQTVVGGMLRAVGDHDQHRLLAFLDRHAATMPRTALRYAIEHLDPPSRAHYRDLGKPGGARV
jgi:3-methyladenine DNA glycosylase AlkD